MVLHINRSVLVIMPMFYGHSPFTIKSIPLKQSILRAYFNKEIDKNRGKRSCLSEFSLPVYVNFLRIYFFISHIIKNKNRDYC